MAKHFEVVNGVVYADIAKLTEKELATVKNYKELGYEVLEKVAEKKEPKEDFKAENVQKWLKKNATEEQQAKYWELFNKPYIDKKTGKQVILKKDGKTGKKGTPRVCGHVATLSWLSETFEEFKTEK